MNLAHVHLALTHVPVVGVLLGLAMLAYAFARDSVELKKASLMLFVLVGAVAAIAYFTGESAENAVEHLAGVSKRAIREHEDAALFGLLASATLGLTSLAGSIVFRQRKPIPRWFSAGSLFLSLIASGAMVWTAGLGGQVRHTEALGWTTAAPTAGESQQQPRSSEREQRRSRRIE